MLKRMLRPSQHTSLLPAEPDETAWSRAACYPEAPSKPTRHGEILISQISMQAGFRNLLRIERAPGVLLEGLPGEALQIGKGCLYEIVVSLQHENMPGSMICHEESTSMIHRYVRSARSDPASQVSTSSDRKHSRTSVAL